jgi:hypothetical protein
VPVPVVDAWVVGVTVLQPRVRVLVRVRLAGRRARRMHMLMMRVVRVRVRHRLVHMPVLVSLGNRHMRVGGIVYAPLAHSAIALAPTWVVRLERVWVPCADRRERGFDSTTISTS